MAENPTVVQSVGLTVSADSIWCWSPGGLLLVFSVCWNHEEGRLSTSQPQTSESEGKQAKGRLFSFLSLGELSSDLQSAVLL